MMGFGVVPNEIVSFIFNYKDGKFEELKHDRNASCEDVVEKFCRKYEFSPLVQLLFGLRIHGTELWLPGCRQLEENKKYELRIRFKIPKLVDLKQLDKNTYDYFYHQVRHDLLHNAIPEFAYPKFKNDILGLCVIDMFLEMIENNKTIAELITNYKKYIPKEISRKHSMFVKREIEASLKNASNNRSYDAYFLKGVYLKEIDSKAPDYLTEKYSGITSCPKEDGLKQNTCCVKIDISPFHSEIPGLRIYYPHKKSWMLLSRFADFYSIQIDKTVNQVNLQIQNFAETFEIRMNSAREMESFVSCLSGYYRLTLKWSMDLCSDLASPSLKFLAERKIHGPIGGKFSYNKIDEKNTNVGTFIVRQCEKVFDTFYIDIVTKENQKETFKIHYNSSTTAGDRWRLLVGEEQQDFENLIELAKSIRIDQKSLVEHFRLPPTEYDLSELLLLCRPRSTCVAQSAASNARNVSPLLLNAVDDLLLNKWSQREWGDGVFTRMKAELTRPNGKKINATLKILKPSEVGLRLSGFMQLADKWAKLDLSEIVKMHGITLQQPISLVMESMEFGPLDEFLKNSKHKKDITLLNLVETANSLAKALHYLQDKQIVHGRIRCSTLQVVQFDPNFQFVVKLGDPGVPLDLTVQDVPWIAIEDYEDLSKSRKNLKGDIWAYATTLWEIFSRGALLNLQNPMEYFKNGHRPARPAECATLPGIYSLMASGWDEDPYKRFSAQTIFKRLRDAETSLRRHYHELNDVPSSNSNGTNGSVSNGTGFGQKTRKTTTGSDFYSGSVMSGETDQTYISSLGITQAYVENGGSSIASNNSHDGGSSQVSLLNGNSSNGSQETLNNNHFYDDILSGYHEIELGRLIFQGKIGEGYYGEVFRGTIEAFEEEIPVAIKKFPTIISDSEFKDFQREAKIMKKLEHKNIVKIYEFCEEPLLIIMEYVSHGSILTYLSINRPNLTVENLLLFASNIAEGMDYLEQQKIVHRDLAGRNILVANESCAKIADFGLAQATDANGYYYHVTNCRSLPILWYAPEALAHHKFSHKSDVWSYGVTLWEMFSIGKSPDLIEKPIEPASLLEVLKSGKRLECPSFCPEEVYNRLMFICWNFAPKLRPNFAELKKRSEEFAADKGERV